MLRSWLDTIHGWRKSLRQRQPVVTIEISRDALVHNLQALQSLAPTWQVAPVLKSNAYGHGLVLVAKILAQEKAIPFLCIDSCFEAEVLRQAGVKTPVFILGYTPTTAIKSNRLKNVAFMVGSVEQLGELLVSGAIQHIQIKFDTGMHRQGIPYTQADEVIKLLRSNSNLIVDGIFSHLADAEVTDSALTKKQVSRWNEIAKEFQTEFPAIHFYHLANSAGFAYHDQIIANVGRPGIALYGVNPGNLSIPLRPVLCMKSIISSIRTIGAGEPIGYNQTIHVNRKTVTATIPVGYFEGVDRRLSGVGVFQVHGVTVSLLGRVSMNMSSCDVTDIKQIGVGTPVVVISNQTADQNSIQHIAKACHTTPHEPLVHIPAHLKRVVVE